MDDISLFQLDSGLSSEGVHLAKKHYKKWNIETKQFKSIRGEIIVLSFELEYTIEHAIADLIVQALTIRSSFGIQQRHEELRHFILEGLDFRRKADILVSILQTRLPRQKDKIRELQTLLNHVRTLRNNMAHKPVIFRVLSENSDELQPFMETSKGYVHITEKLVNQNKNNVKNAAALIKEMMIRIKRLKKPQIEII